MDDDFQIVDLARQDMRRPGDGAVVGVEIGVDRMILSDPFVEKIDVIRGGQMAPVGEQFPPGSACRRFHPLDVPKQFVLSGISQPAEGISAGIRPGGGGQGRGYLRTGHSASRKLHGNFGRRRHDQVRMLFERLRQSPPEFENPLLAPDVLADVFVIVTEQDHLAVDQGEVSGVLLRRNGVWGNRKAMSSLNSRFRGMTMRFVLRALKTALGEIAASSFVNMSSRFSQRMDW